MSKRRVLIFTLTLVALFLLGGAVTVWAAGPDDVPPEAAPLVIDMDLQETGGWSIQLGGLGLEVTSQTFDALSRALNLGMQAPVVSPELVNLAMVNGVQDFALIKEGNKTTVMINSQPLSALTISDSAVRAFTDFAQFGPELYGLAAQVNHANLTVALHFPPAPGAEVIPTDLGARIEATQGEALNSINLGGTFSPQGQLISVGGVPLSAIGLPGPVVDTTLLRQLGVNDVSVSLANRALTVSANQEEWARLDLNTDYLIETSPTVLNLLGMPYDQQQVSVIGSLANSWLDATRITVSGYMADAPAEETVLLQLGRPILVEMANDNSIAVEGFATGRALDANTAAWVNSIGSAVATWDQGQFRVATATEQLPYLELDRGFITTVATALFGDAYGSYSTIAENILMNTKLNVAVATGGVPAPDVSVLEYQAAEAQPVASVVPQAIVSRNSGAVGLYGETVPFGLISQFTGTDFSQVIAAYAGTYRGIETLGVRLGPQGLTLSVNGSTAHLRWDPQLRDVVVNTALDLGIQQLALPAAVDSGIVRQSASAAVETINQAEIGLDIQLVDEDLEPGVIERLATVLF